MEERSKLLIDRKLLLGLTVIGFVLGIAGAFIKYHTGSSLTEVSSPTALKNIFYEIGLIFLVVVWTVVFIDLVRNDIRNKVWWFLGMVLLIPIIPVLYLLTIKR